MDIHATSYEALLDVVANNTKVALFTKKLGGYYVWDEVQNYILGGGDLVYNISWSPSNLKARVFVEINDEKVVLWEDWDGLINIPIPIISTTHIFIEFYGEDYNIIKPDECSLCLGILRDVELYRKRVIRFEIKGITLYNALNSIIPTLELLQDYYQFRGEELEIVSIEELL